MNVLTALRRRDAILCILARNVFRIGLPKRFAKRFDRKTKIMNKHFLRFYIFVIIAIVHLVLEIKSTSNHIAFRSWTNTLSAISKMRTVIIAIVHTVIT